MQTPPPPAPTVEIAQPAPAPPTPPVQVSHQADNVIIASSDRPMILVKGGHREQAILRYVLYLETNTTVLRPSTPPGPDQVYWAYKPYVQRSLCFIAITGDLACRAAEAISLEEKSEGKAALAAPAPPSSAPGTQTSVPTEAGTPAPGSPTSQGLPGQAAEPSAADIALSKLSDALRQEAAAKFDEDYHLNVASLLRAAGVQVLLSPSAVSK